MRVGRFARSARRVATDRPRLGAGGGSHRNERRPPETLSHPYRIIGYMSPHAERPSQARVDPLGPVFISYRQSDGTETAVALAWSLRAAGVPVWHDQTDLPPGDTARRLQEALESGLSGAILVITPEISSSDVVRDIELPALLELSRDPSFTLSIASTVTKEPASDELDYAAPDRLLGTAPGTLSAVNQRAVHTASARSHVAQAQARRRVEHLRPAIAEAGNILVLDVQSRVPPFAATNDAHLVMRLRPPTDGQRRPSREALDDLQGFLGQLPQLVAIGGAGAVHVRGGAHLSIACAIGAALPTTLLGDVLVTDTAGNTWHLNGQAPVEAPDRFIAPVEPIAHNRDRGPVLVYADLLPQRSDPAFNDLLRDLDFAGVAHLRPVADGLLDPNSAARLVGELTSAIRELAGDHATTEVHLLLRCPYPFAVLLGRSLNTLTVHLYEWEDSDEADRSGPRYVPSLVLRSGAGGSSIHRVSAPPTPSTTEAT